MPQIQLIANPGFEAGAFSWTFTATGGASAMVVPNTTEPAHTGLNSAQLISGNLPAESASVSQTINFPLLPLSSLRFSFFLRRDLGSQPTNITATVTPLFSFAPVITISIPINDNPGTSADNWEYYEEYGSILFPSLGAMVNITVAGGASNEVLLDDIFLTLTF